MPISDPDSHSHGPCDSDSHSHGSCDPDSHLVPVTLTATWSCDHDSHLVPVTLTASNSFYLDYLYYTQWRIWFKTRNTLYQYNFLLKNKMFWWLIINTWFCPWVCRPVFWLWVRGDRWRTSAGSHMTEKYTQQTKLLYWYTSQKSIHPQLHILMNKRICYLCSCKE